MRSWVRQAPTSWSNWKPRRGVTSDYVAAALGPYYDAICQAGVVGIYSTFDMFNGIDLLLLRQWENMLCSLAKLDPQQGGCFSNHDAAADALLKLDTHMRVTRSDLRLEKNLLQYLEQEKIAKLLAFKIRVMLAHARKRCALGVGGLDKLDTHLQIALVKWIWSSKGRRADESSCVHNEVATFFDVGANAAKILMHDGSSEGS